jgi:hypothetical protein
MADKEKKVRIGEVFIAGARLSFADLWTPKKFSNDPKDADKKARFKANFLLPKDNTVMGKWKGKTMPALIALKKAKEAVLHEWDPKFDPRKLKEDAHCVRDGDKSGVVEVYDGYEGQYYVSSTNTTAPVVVDQVRKPLLESSGRPYSGCYVNGIVELYVQKPGKNDDGTPRPLRVNASLKAVQMKADGEAFGAQAIDPMKGFEDISGEEGGDYYSEDEDENDDLV